MKKPTNAAHRDAVAPDGSPDHAVEGLRLEFWPIERLVPSPRNARTHSEAQVAEIAGSIRAFGFANPILVRAGGRMQSR